MSTGPHDSDQVAGQADERADSPAGQHDRNSAGRLSSARMYAYWLGHPHLATEAEIAACEAINARLHEQPVQAARANRAFYRRAALWMASHTHLDQYVDLGCGIPVRPAAHDVIRRVRPNARVVYVDSDPLVVEEGRRLLEGVPGVTVMLGNLLAPDALWESPELRELINVHEPVGMFQVAIWHFLNDQQRPHARFRDWIRLLAPDSWVAFSHATADNMAPHRVRHVSEIYDDGDAAITFRTHAEIDRFWREAGLWPTVPYPRQEAGSTFISLWGCEDPGDPDEMDTDDPGGRWGRAVLARKPRPGELPPRPRREELANPRGMYSFALGWHPGYHDTILADGPSSGSRSYRKVDAQAARRLLEEEPTVPIHEIAWRDKGFSGRAVKYMVNDRRIQQIIDFGTGSPDWRQTHIVAQRNARRGAAVKVVYVNDDAEVTAWGRRILEEQTEDQELAARTRFIEHDLRNPELVLQDPELRELIDFTKPIGLVFAGQSPLAFIPNEDDPWGIMGAYLDALPPGSAVAISHPTAGLNAPKRVQAYLDGYAHTQRPITLRTEPQIDRLLRSGRRGDRRDWKLVPPYQGATAEWTWAGWWGAIAGDTEGADDIGSHWLRVGVAVLPKPEAGKTLDTSKASPAGMYSYYLGGKDYLAADAAAAEKIAAKMPELRVAAVENREFLIRAVRWAARQNKIQYLDLGSGLPTDENTHQIAGKIHPGARVAYVDTDPRVLAHARALLADERDRVRVIQADINDPDEVWSTPGLDELIVDNVPTVLIMVAVCHFLPDFEELVAKYVAELPPQSIVVMSHITHEGTDPERVAVIEETYKTLATTPIIFRGKADLEAVVERCGLHLVPPWPGADPEVVRVGQWGVGAQPHRPEGSQWCWAFVAVKPPYSQPYPPPDPEDDPTGKVAPEADDDQDD